MVYNQTLTIWKLPPRPLLAVNDIRDPIFVTTWLVVCFIAAFYLRNLLKREQNPTWQEFRAVRYGTTCLAIWYLVRVTDRWLRYDQRTTVEYGYALAEPMYEIIRVTSTILILWGTYTLVWKELEDQFSPRQQGIWWFSARFLLFISTLMTIYYIVLGVALVVAWLEFLSLNAIADIAGKRNDFEMAMTAFFFLFALLTLLEATVAWFHAFKIHGQVQRTRLLMWLAALFLFVRSTSELAIVNDLYKLHATRQNMKFTSDVSYGLLTMLYLAMICAMAHVAASGFDSGGRQANLVASDVRHFLLNMLEALTNGGRRQPPPFDTILREVERNLDTVLSRGPLTGTLNMDPAYKKAAALDCIEQLRAELGRLGQGEGNNHASSPPSTISVLTTLFGRRPGQGMRNRSSTTLNTFFTETTAVTRPVPEQPRGVRRTPSIYNDVTPEPFPATPLLGDPATATEPGPAQDNNNLARWEPYPDEFQEQPQPYQDTPTLPFDRHDMPRSPSPGPPPLANQPVAPTAPPVAWAPYAMDATNAPSQPPTTSPTSETANGGSLVPISQPQDLVPTEGIPPPTELQSRSSVQVSSTDTPGASHISDEIEQDLPTPTPRPQGLARFQRRPPSDPSSSSPSNRTLASPQATAGSSYRSLQAQRFEGRAPDSSSSASGPGTGYQVQPNNHTSSALGDPNNSTSNPGTSSRPQPQRRRNIYTADSFDAVGFNPSSPFISSNRYG
ncbi:hypothetical protein V8F20_012815 [Naviculisporaceae sp. PSN 640]